MALPSEKHHTLPSSADAEIIIRCYNEEDWIVDCIRAIESQSLCPRLVTIVDNDSSDSTLMRANWIRKNTPLAVNVETFSNSKEGYRPGKILNHFCLRSSAKYVVCLSAHCVPATAQWLENLYKFIDRAEDIAAVYGKQIPTFKSDSRDSRDLYWTFGCEDKLSSVDPFFHNANSIIRTSVLRELPFREDIKNIEDRVWAKELLMLGQYKIGYSSKAIVFHEHGIHQAGKQKRAEQIVEITQKFVESDVKATLLDNMICIIPYKPKSNILTDDEAGNITKAIEIAQSAGFKPKSIVCSFANCIQPLSILQDLFPDVTIMTRNNLDSTNDPDMRTILNQISYECLSQGLLFRDILVLEPSYNNRSLDSIVSLIKKYNQSPNLVALFNAQLNVHVWHERRKSLIRIDSYENSRNKQEKLMFSPRGLGMILRASKLQDQGWLDGNA